jgi:hypothetical protein
VAITGTTGMSDAERGAPKPKRFGHILKFIFRQKTTKKAKDTIKFKDTLVLGKNLQFRLITFTLGAQVDQAGELDHDLGQVAHKH